jgi:cysteinyl-tRNA synthetase
MSKSLRNFYRIDDLEAKGFEPVAFRYFSLSGHYRSPLNFTWESLGGAQNALRNLKQDILRLMREETARMEAKPEDTRLLRQKFVEAVNDDLNMPQALAVTWEAAQTLKGKLLLETIKDFDRVLGLGLSDLEALEREMHAIPHEIQEFARQRDEARRAKDWQAADALRKKAGEMGYLFEDGPEGTVIKKKV